VPLTQEQQDLRAAVRGLLDRYPTPPDANADAERSLWGRLCTEIGVGGLAIPDRFGGSGAGPVEVHVVMEELGRSLTPAPMLGSAVLATQALLAAGDEASCERLLPSLATGTKIAALAWTTAAGRWDPDEVACSAASHNAIDGWVLTGETHFVLDGEMAATLLVPAVMPDGRTCLFEVDPAQPGVTRTLCPTMDESRRLSVVQLNGAAGLQIGERVDLEQVRTAACIALSAEQVGAAAAALELTVAYAKVRVQFGQPIGSFQALQHRMAEMHVLVESSRSLSYAAAEAARSSAPDVWLRAAAAKAYCSEALERVASEMIQLHGAIGMTWEHVAHRYFKRGHGAAFLLGAPAGHIARIAGAVVDG
jgi:alkylation response protein AidB-like acyl-CoA dehydrogenase